MRNCRSGECLVVACLLGLGDIGGLCLGFRRGGGGENVGNLLSA